MNYEFENELRQKVKNELEIIEPTKIAETEHEKPGSNDDQVHFLYTELQASQARNLDLEKQLNTYIELLAEKGNGSLGSEELKNLQEQNKISKLAEAIEGNSVASNLDLKQKLNEMIKEVDRCIAKLSS
jgi:hypothetical protein